MDWKEYQEEVALFFKSIGATAVTNAAVNGVRGTHMADVLVSLKHFGVDVTWVVECKLWKTSVPKEKILTLQQIVQDIGADRGFLMSESGFQAGAIKCAQTSNVTLSSLSELHEMAAEELLNLKLKAVSVKLEGLTRRYYKFIPWPKFSKIKYVELAVEYLPNLYLIRLEIPKAFNGNFPVRLLSKTIFNLLDFLKECEDVCGVCELEIEKVEKQYDENYRAGYLLVETWHSLINQLVSITRQIVDQTGDDNRQDKTRIKAAGIMKKIGNTTDKLSAYIARDAEHAFATVNKWLIDGLYLDLLNVDLQHEDLRRTNEGLQKALSDFARDFQPINIPPVPKMPS